MNKVANININAIQYVSKIFLNYIPNGINYKHIVEPGYAATLCLLGDIGCPTDDKTHDFLSYCSRNWDNVLWVPGILELAPKRIGVYNFSMIDNLKSMHELSSNIPRLKIMNNNYHKIGDYLLLGTPLWGMNYSPNEKYNLSSPRPDNNKMNPFEIISYNKYSIAWLDGHIAEAFDFYEKVICMTYSPPVIAPLSGRDTRRYNMMKNYEYGLVRNPVKLWIIGDLYESIDSYYNNIPFASNSMFYNLFNKNFNSNSFTNKKIMFLL